MTAINKMVEWLLAKNKNIEKFGYDLSLAPKEWWDGRQGFYESALTEARRLAQEEAKEKPVGDEAQKRYYNECARNSVLYDLGAALIEELEKWEPGTPFLEKAEEQLEGNGYSLGRPTEKPTAPASLVEELKKSIDGHKKLFESQQAELDTRIAAVENIEDILSRYHPQTDVVGELKAFLDEWDKQGFTATSLKVREIIRKYEGEK